MKASIFLATHNKNRELPNVLHSITRQVTSFPFEIIICDDASDDIHTLREVVHAHLATSGIPYKFICLSHNVGCGRSQGFCLDFMDPESDIIVLQSSDVFYVYDYVLQDLCEKVSPGVFTMAEVRNVETDPNMWMHYEKNALYYMDEDRLHETLAAINKDPKQPRAGSYKLCHTIFSGPRQPDPGNRWYFFLGAILKEDLLKTCFATDCFDVHLSNDLHRLGMQVRYVPVLGIHQKHPIGG